MQGLQRVVESEGINVSDYSLLMAVHSNSFTHLWCQSARNVPLEEWIKNGLYTRAWLEDLARKLSSAEVMDPQRDGVFVQLTFVKSMGRGGKNGRYAWETIVVYMAHRRSNQSERKKDNRPIVLRGHVSHLHGIRHQFVHVTHFDQLERRKSITCP